VPAIALVEQPSRPIDVIVGQQFARCRKFERRLRERALVLRFWRKRTMHCFMGEIEEERLFPVGLTLEKLDGAARQKRGDVTVLRHPLAVIVDRVFIVRWIIPSLTFEANPVVEAGAGIVAAINAQRKQVTRKPLIRGSRGDAVKTAQSRLGALGFDCGPADGIYGRKTAWAVKQLQKKKKLPTTGAVDARTFDALFT